MWRDMTKLHSEIATTGGKSSVTQVTKPRRGLDVQQVRSDFPILATKSHGKPLVYLDNGATTQKPLAVIEALEAYYKNQNANIHRGGYALSQTPTTLYERRRR